MRKFILMGTLLAVCFLLLVADGPALAQERQQDVTLIKGLDGGTYEPYAAAVIEKVQTALKAEGLYPGEVTGVLDEDTMKALGEFQRQHNLTVSGVPSPQTRKLLLKE